MSSILLNFAHIWAFLHWLLALDGILSVHHHGDWDEEQGEDGVSRERDPEQRDTQHRRDHQLQGAGKGLQYRVELLEKQACDDAEDGIINDQQQNIGVADWLQRGYCQCT